jgi:GTP cyclohydrolase I
MGKVNYQALEKIAYNLLTAIGEDPEREGLKETPRRFASMWREFISYDPGTIDTCFESVTTDQMVVISGMRIWSLCEHHLLPFWCDVSIGYIARDKVLGLSKFARIAHKHAHTLQLQERLCHQIADELMQVIDTNDVAVLASGRHLCMEMRGIRTPGLMTSSVTRGIFRESNNARMEFLQLVGGVK